MPYLEITGLPIRTSGGVFGSTVSLSLEKGRGLSILSSDGSAPKALADALTGFGGFTGEIFLNDRRIDPLAARNRPVRVLGDSQGFFPRLTVKENLTLAVSEGRLSDTEATFAVDLELSESMLGGFDDALAGSLDDAGRTILAAARALLRGCDLLIIARLPVPGPGKYRDDSWVPGFQMDALLDLKNLLRRHRATWVSLLTDPACVHVLSDRVMFFSGDNLVQEGSLRECQNAPQSRLVADFLAFPRMNYRTSRVERDGPFILLRTGRYVFRVSEFGKRQLLPRDGEEVILGLRPEDLSIRPFVTGDPTVINLAKVTRVDSVPGAQVVRLDLEGIEWIAMVEPGRVVFTGQLIELRPDPDKIHVFHPVHGTSLLD
jgi:ABC-type sugar transport system ATPase subunit